MSAQNEVTKHEAPETAGRCILAIDTSIGTSVALGVDGVIYSAVSENPRGHAEAVGTLLASVFEASGTAASRVETVIGGMGPGPFTGLRVGIVAAQAFAAGRGLPLLGIESHEAAALAALEAGAAAAVSIVTDARRRELFITEFGSLDWAGVPVKTAGPRLVTRVAHEAAATGADTALEVSGAAGAGSGASSANELWPSVIDPAALVRLAARRLAAGMPFTADQALYLREPDVVQPGPQKRVSA